MLPRRALTNIDLINYAKMLEIPNFRGVFMRDDLPLKIKQIECGIVNLDSKRNEGTHWTAYVKNQHEIIYFDSMGNLRPPFELIKYFYSDGSNNNIFYNYENYQKHNDYNCGHLCLEFLYKTLKVYSNINK